MNKKYQVFVSSTYEDLKEERSAVMQCLLDNNCIPVGMEQFPASNMRQIDYIRKMLNECDYYILILAGRYGSIDTEDGIGYTEKEYNYAISSNIPVMSFVVADIDVLPKIKCEQTKHGNDLLRKFRHKVMNGKLVKLYSNKDELKAEVVTALHKCIEDYPAIGWVRGDAKAVITLENIDAYLKKQFEENFDQRLAESFASDEEVQQILDEVFDKKTEGFARIHSGSEPPADMKNGDLFIRSVEDEK